MGAQATREHRVAIDVEVLRGDRRRDVWPGAVDESGGFGGGDMFEHHFQRRKIGDQTRQHPLDEHRLAIEHVDRRIGHLAVDQ